MTTVSRAVGATFLLALAGVLVMLGLVVHGLLGGLGLVTLGFITATKWE